MNASTVAPAAPAPDPQPDAYPVHVDAELDPDVSRGLWLVKWLLAIPHYVVLAFLWVAFAVVTLVAFVAIVLTGHYPRPLFDFNVGVMRWSWRVSFYAYGALGTDRYPPFTLAEVPDYPAHLSVDHPEHLSRGLALVKWWLLALPHYLVLALFVGGIGYGVSGADDDPVVTVSLVGILVLVAGVVLLVTGRYPRPLFDLLLGVDRWVLRVAAYAALMTDRYPPFRLDQGPHDPAPGGVAVHPPAPVAPAPATEPHEPYARPGRRGWTTGRVTAVVVGALLVVMSCGLGGTGATLAVADGLGRDAQGFLTGPTRSFSTDAFALTSSDLEVHTGTTGGTGWWPDRILGDVEVVASAPPGERLFVGIARARDVAAYLDGVRHARVLEVRNGTPVYDESGGGRPATPPGEASIWAASDTGTRPRLTWSVEDGDWTVVLMSADASAPVEADVRAGAEVPVLDTAIAVLLLLAAATLAAGVALVVVPTRAARRTTG
ncbi:hypothetical protein ASG76_04590 [Nocardioides sp. Soil774]|uniref:DUF4389 domain-containing protein n=1 Tax=Nocardioides sp. Soil774 TaxID=1736408 RepID=UPI0006FE84B9|nr:DUF4389 domain-containing protein [Nocardioides sp. Soil774]KRE96416.1 hypothetical protein ASG76_04590 [Nocardioides sp. Soil774]